MPDRARPGFSERRIFGDHAGGFRAEGQRGGSTHCCRNPLVVNCRRHALNADLSTSAAQEAARPVMVLVPKTRSALVWLWALTLIAFMLAPLYIPTASLVIGLLIGSLVGIYWKTFTSMIAITTVVLLALITCATFLAFRSNVLLWNAVFGTLAILAVFARLYVVRPLAISNVTVNGSLGFCVGYLCAISIASRLPHEGLSFDWEGLVWTPLVLLFATAVPFLVFLLGCAALLTLKPGKNAAI